MSTSKLPRSIRFDSEVDQKISVLMKTFDESAVKVLHRAVEYLYENQEAAIDLEAQKRKTRMQDQK
ncbi:hypothetical protein GCM10028809_32430 [Spirosoma gilvum]